MAAIPEALRAAPPARERRCGPHLPPVREWHWQPHRGTLVLCCVDSEVGYSKEQHALQGKRIARGVPSCEEELPTT